MQLNQNSKLGGLGIILSVLIAFLIAFSILNYVLYNHYQDANKFYLQNFDSEKKILLIGSSQTGQLNATHIEEYLYLHGKKYDIYNLAISSDTPEQRLSTINKIISINPNLVVYGVGFRDFEDESNTTPEIVSSPLFNPHKFFEDFLTKHPIAEFYNFQSPRSTTLDILTKLVSSHSEESYSPRSPFYKPMININTNQQELETEGKRSSFSDIPPVSENTNALALEKIIQKLHQKNIQTIVFTTPYDKYVQENLQPHYYDKFKSVVDEIARKEGISIYFIDNKYANLDIWSNSIHIAFNKNSEIYSENVAQIIEKGINP